MYVQCTYIITEPTKAPRNVQVKSIQPTAASLKWKSIQCHYKNGKIERYLIRYDHVKIVEGSVIQEYAQTAGNIKRFVLHDLIPNTKYSVRVAGISAAGIGVYSRPIGFVTPGGKKICVGKHV